MRISDDRYSRDRQRLDIALRFIENEARTRTIRQWTGLTDDRIRKLYRSYLCDAGARHVQRHRGKSPHQAAHFLRTLRMRQETALLASICSMLGVLPGIGAPPMAARLIPGIRRGQLLCQAFDVYRSLIDQPQMRCFWSIAWLAAKSWQRAAATPAARWLSSTGCHCANPAATPATSVASRTNSGSAPRSLRAVRAGTTVKIGRLQAPNDIYRSHQQPVQRRIPRSPV
jgi:hypothetical protein